MLCPMLTKCMNGLALNGEWVGPKNMFKIVCWFMLCTIDIHKPTNDLELVCSCVSSVLLVPNTVRRTDETQLQTIYSLEISG
jgi:hypothetical protein